MTRGHTCHDSFIFMTWLTQMCALTRSYVWQASFTCVTWLVIAALIACNTLQYTATHCNTLQHTATHCNTLHHNATHCNTLQHAACCRCGIPVCMGVAWRIHIYVTWLLRICDMTHSDVCNYMWHDSFRCAHTHTHTYTHTHTHTYIYICSYIHMCHLRKHICIYVHMYICMCRFCIYTHQICAIHRSIHMFVYSMHWYVCAGYGYVCAVHGSIYSKETYNIWSWRLAGERHSSSSLFTFIWCGYD